MRRRGSVGVLLSVVFLAAAGCGGGEADNAYIEHSDAGLFMRLPPDWATFQVLNDNPQTDAAAGPWRVVFDGATNPDRGHVEEPAPGDPVGFVEIDPTPQGSGVTTYEDMRSLLTSSSAVEPVDPLDSPDFDVVDYDEFDLGKFYGNRLTVNTLSADGDIRVTQIVATDDGGDHLYVVRLLCSVECYDDNADEIDAVLDSFTLEAR
jgi:hypothetical protein